MSLSIAVLSDLHFAESPNPNCPDRRGELAELLLLRSVHRLNRFLKPDVVLLLGDLVDEGHAPGAPALLRQVRETMDKLACPYLAIPGNHDGSPERFARVFGDCPDWLEVNGFRLVPFIDPEEPGYNARRRPQEVERLKGARRGFDGRLICLQHVPVFPEGSTPCPYNYTNAAEVLAAMAQAEVALSVSGHYHPGEGPHERGGVTLLAAPALCERPFLHLWVEVGDDGRVSVETHRLSCPDGLEVWDWHVHTSLAYCNENMDMRKALALTEAFGLGGIAFAEHTAHLYFDQAHYREGAFWSRGLSGADTQRRLEQYFAMYEEARAPNSLLGLEVDCDYSGRQVVCPQDAAKAEVLLGAVHSLPPASGGGDQLAGAEAAFMRMTGSLLRSGIDILAHPFRAFRRAGLPLPDHLFEPVAELLQEAGVAAEINFHTNDPHPIFVRSCVERGVRLALGSDAHNLWEVGEFWPHLRLLEQIGVPVETERLLGPGLLQTAHGGRGK